jgi:hypothetical protein
VLRRFKVVCTGQNQIGRNQCRRHSTRFPERRRCPDRLSHFYGYCAYNNWNNNCTGFQATFRNCSRIAPEWLKTGESVPELAQRFLLTSSGARFLRPIEEKKCPGLPQVFYLPFLAGVTRAARTCSFGLLALRLRMQRSTPALRPRFSPMRARAARPGACS